MSTSTGIYVVIPASNTASANLDCEFVMFAIEHLAPKCILLPAPRDNQIELWRKAIENCHNKDVTALLLDDCDHVKATGADGVHIPYGPDIVDRYQNARTKLGTSAIIGTDAANSRHDAMLLGEAGADYIAFGNTISGQDDLADDRNEMLKWWSALFEVPCVAFDIATPAEARAAAESGAEFITVTVQPTLNTDEAASNLSDFRAAINGANA